MKPWVPWVGGIAFLALLAFLAFAFWPDGDGASQTPPPEQGEMFTPEGSEDGTATAEPTTTPPLPPTPGTATEVGTTDSSSTWSCPSYQQLATIWATDAEGVWAKPIDATTYELTGLYFDGGQLTKVALRPDQTLGDQLADAGWIYLETVENTSGSYQWWAPPVGIEPCVRPPQ